MTDRVWTCALLSEMMSSDEPAVTPAESNTASVDVGDDALQDLITEAETLMTNLDKEASDLAGFSIDSDDEGDDPLTAMAATPTAVEDHPLSMEHLSSPPQPAASMGSNAPSSLPSIFANGTTMNGPAAAQMAAGTAATMDSLKQSTSRFASGLASMAQRAANQVAAATAPMQVAGGPVPMTGHTMPGTMSTPMSSYTPTYPASMANKPPPTARNTSSGPTMAPAVELDNEQKTKLIQEHVGPLLGGERIIMFLSNLLHVSDTSGLSYVASQSPDSYMWCCAMSYYRLILFSTASKEKVEIPVPQGWNVSCWPSSPAATKLLEIPLAAMDRVEKTVYQAAGSSYMGIVIYAKDCGRVMRFTTPNYADTGRAFDSLNTYAFPGRRNLGYLFAFESKREAVMASVQLDEATGQNRITIPPIPKRFDPMIEYPRLLNKTSITNTPWTLWASVNNNYQLSPTYPSVLVGPATLEESKQESHHLIYQCAAFRSEKRLPAMSWCGVGGASIWRASQPKVGLQGNRSPADELFLRHIAESARGANAMADPAPIYSRSVLQQLTGDFGRDWVPETGCSLKVLDLRPRAAAMANRTGGRFCGMLFLAV